jgi:peptide/nickel transport system permease protein
MVVIDAEPAISGRNRLGLAWRLLLADPFALASGIFLIAIVVAALLTPLFVPDGGTHAELRLRNFAPFTLDHGFAYVLGGDSLGRSLLNRVLIGGRNSLSIAAAAVVCSAISGALLGLIAGYFGRAAEHIIMRLADMVSSFPSLLLALVVLYVLGSDVGDIVVVLAIAGTPVYIRATRAEVLEIRQRLFVTAARAIGAKSRRIILRHVLPLIVPTLLTIASLEFAAVILTESTLSFLGLGLQLPQYSWGSMVAAGQDYLATAWWVAFWPGLAILLTTVSLNALAQWARIATDPRQRWRLEKRRWLRR